MSLSLITFYIAVNRCIIGGSNSAIFILPLFTNQYISKRKEFSPRCKVCPMRANPVWKGLFAKGSSWESQKLHPGAARSFFGGGRVVRWSWVNFQCRGVLLIWITVRQGPSVLAVGAGGGCMDIFTLIYPFFPLSPSLWETARYRLKYCLKGPLNPKPTKQPTNTKIVSLCALGETWKYNTLRGLNFVERLPMVCARVIRTLS